MKHNNIIISILALFILLPFGLTSCSNEKSKEQQEKWGAVTSAWEGVQTACKTLPFLLDNLVNIVRKYAPNEEEAIQSAIRASNKAAKITITPENLTPEKLQEFQDAQYKLSEAIDRLLFLNEDYPAMNEDQAFLELELQLEGSSNDIHEAIESFNDVASEYHQQYPDEPSLTLE